MASARRDISAIGWRGGFTLVELLVTIAIIALLIAILLPALAKARDSARSAMCLSNHRQLCVSFAAYTNDYHTFPYGDSALSSYNLRFSWGGVNWYPSTGVVPGINVPADRPLNPYIGSAARIESPMAVFRCPLDTGAHNFVSGRRDWDADGATSSSGLPTTCYGVAGSSYEANGWMYCKPGALDGWSISANFRSNLGPQHILVDPSHFVVFCDIGPANWMVFADYYLTLYDLWGEWWHGSLRSPMGFLDGSARVEAFGGVVSRGYSFHLVPMSRWNANTGYHWPDHQ